MSINFSFSTDKLKKLQNFADSLSPIRIVLSFSIILSIAAIAYSYFNNIIIAYGDAESHLNIAKRVVTSLTPGLAQLGGIWLPLPHLLMVPFVYFNFLWRTGLAGSIVSGTSFIISCVYLFKIVYFVTKNKLASFFGALVFALNPNILYMQSTPMTELPLVVFFILSTYYFIVYMQKRTFIPLVMAGVFAFFASLSRYDGWFLVAFELLSIAIINFDYRKFIPNLKKRGIGIFSFLTEQQEGELFLFGVIGVIGVIGWFVWDFLILGDPLYFTDSPFSAKSQQHNWLAKHELPGYHNLWNSFIYYFITSMENVGILIFVIAICGLVLFVKNNKNKAGILTVLIFSAPFVFNVATLFLGQSVIFIPDLTPVGYEWRLFNVRYGVMMVPFIAFLSGYLFSRIHNFGKWLLIGLLAANIGLFVIGYAPVETLADGTIGLSASKRTDVEFWLTKHYDNGLVMIDDYARTTSIVRTGIPMENIVYIGTRGYWQEALKAPQLRIKWIVLQKGDTLWNAFYSTPDKQGRLYKYFNKAYTSKEILVFRRIGS